MGETEKVIHFKECSRSLRGHLPFLGSWFDPSSRYLLSGSKATGEKGEMVDNGNR